MQFARVAARHKLVSRRQLAGWGFEHLRYRLRGTTDERTTEVLRAARELIAGVPARSFERMNPEVMAAILPRVYPQMLDEVYAHQDAGRPTFIVSAAGSGVVEPLATVLGMDGGVGTRYGVGKDGALTGRFDGPFVYGEGKVEAMKAFAAEHEIDLAASYAYSDSVSDLPMLRAVGNPVVVNPDPPLLEIAREEGWQVMRFERLGRRLVAVAVTCWRRWPASAAPASPPAASSRPAASRCGAEPQRTRQVGGGLGAAEDLLDPTFAVDDHRHRQAENAVARSAPGGGAQAGEGPAVAVDEGKGRGAVVFPVDADERGAAVQSPGEALEFGRLFAAGLAPAGPEVDRRRPAAQGADGHAGWNQHLAAAAAAPACPVRIGPRPRGRAGRRHARARPRRPRRLRRSGCEGSFPGLS